MIYNNDIDPNVEMWEKQNDNIVTQVTNKYSKRSQLGIAKYGTTLEDNNKDNYLKHLQEELMDATLYLQKIMDQNREITKLVRDHSNDAELGMKIRSLIR
jgi:ribosomal 50S subunit-associated protein YjgA (DUF615 family)